MPHQEEGPGGLTGGTTTTPSALPPPLVIGPVPTGGGGAAGGGGGGTRGVAGARAILRRLFLDLGLPLSLVSWGLGRLRAGFSMEALEAALYERPEFRRAYGFLFRRDGSLIMSPFEAVRTIAAHRSIATAHGFSLTRAQAGRLIATEKSPDEFRSVFAPAIQRLRSNVGVFAELNRQLSDINRQRQQRGLPGLPHVRTPEAALNFILGQSPQSVYDLYEAAQTGAAARGAGLQVSTARARELARGTVGVLAFEETEQRFGEIARQLREAGPELAVLKVTQRELEIIQFGGPKRAELAQKAELALRQRKAQLQARPIGPQVSLAGGRPVVPTEQEPSL